MSSKKKSSSSKAKSTPKPAAAKPVSGQKNATKRPLGLIIGIVVVVIIAIGVIVATSQKSGNGAGSTAGSTPSGVDPAEAKYIGRLLPASYEEPKLADIVVYTESTPMTDVTAKVAGSALEISKQDVTDKRNVYFEYTKADGTKLPMIAYLKPSGKLFVGVSFCPPCEGERQRIESDGTLTCESCGTKRTLETGVGISGACKLYPIDEVPVTVTGGTISIDKAVLDNWTPQPKDRQVG